MQTFLFYDIETTGLNKSFDQILQFAAIRTDLELNELDRYEIKIKLNPDITPAPRALITHQISIKEMLEGEDEYSAIQKIHRLMNTPGTISLGFNTLGFDDEFLRFSFYRHLLPAYTHQFANQCSRRDIYPMTIMYFLFQNNVLNWPTKTLKLEALNLANGWVKGRAHLAMVDVEATLALAKKLFAEKKMWEYVSGYFNKAQDDKRSLENKLGLMVYGKVGTENLYQCPVLFLGAHRHYKNQTLWLRLDAEKLTATTGETIAENTFVYKKKSAEPGFILPFQEKYLMHLSSDRLEKMKTNQAWLEQNPKMLEKIIDYHAEFKYPIYPNTDMSAALYTQGFWTSQEERFCQQFHRATPKDKVRITETLSNARLKTLATRILNRHFSDVTSESLKIDFQNYLAQSEVIDYRGEKKLTAKAALLEITEIKKDPNITSQQVLLLEELEKYLQ